jgi:rRNA processing protein Gar1
MDRPLGKILHVVDGEAITRPNTPFRAPNSKVVLEDLTEIGILKEPFGPTSKPYQPIKLTIPNSSDIIGKLAFAQVVKRKNRRRWSKK